MKHQHRGFLGVDSAIMIGFLLLSVMAVMVMHMGIIAMISPDLHTTINKMPTIYDYDEDGDKVEFETPAEKGNRFDSNNNIKNEAKEIKSEIIKLEDEKYDAIGIGDVEKVTDLSKQIKELEKKLVNLGYLPEPNMYLKLYWIFGSFSIMVLGIIFIISIVILGFERASLGMKRGTASRLVKSCVIGIIIILIVPEIWDPIAITVEKVGLYMLDPIDGKPEETTGKLWCRMGGTCTLDQSRLLDEDIHKMLLANPADFGQEIFAKVFLGFFKLTATSMISLLFFITSTIRITFTLVILITIPLWIIFGFIPKLKKLSETVLSSFVGACMAPPLVSIILFIGEQHISANPLPALTEWITVLGVAILAQTFLMILAPVLQSTLSQANSIVQSGMQQTTMAASAMGVGAAAGAMSTKGNAGKGSSIPTSMGGVTSSFANMVNPMTNTQKVMAGAKAGITGSVISGMESLTKTHVPSSIKQGLINNAGDSNSSDIQDDDEK